MEILIQNVLTNVERINELESALTIFNSKRSLSQSETDLCIKKIGASTLLIDTKVPDSIYFNRIKGFGMNDLDKMEEILDIYDTEKITPCFDMTPNNITMEVSQALMNKGYFCFEQLNFLEIEPHFTKCENEEIKIVKVTENNVEEFLNLISLQTGRELTEDLIKKKAEYYYQPTFQNYIAYIGDQAAGVASLFIKGVEGYLANAFTFSSVRGKEYKKNYLNDGFKFHTKQD